MRLSDAGLHQRRTKALYSNHRLPPWPNGDAPRDRSNRLLDDTQRSCDRAHRSCHSSHRSQHRRTRATGDRCAQFYGNHVSAETSIQTASSTSTCNATPTPRNRFAKRSGPDWTIEVGIEQRHLDTHTAAPATGATADHHSSIFALLMSSNSVVTRRNCRATTKLDGYVA
jgi:hypothetical protein